MSSFSEEENAAIAEDAQIDAQESADDGEAFDSAPLEDRSSGGFGAWLRGIWDGSPDHRLDDLSDAIIEYPDAPANYVLRGEVWMQLAEYELAADDFEQALALAAAQFEEESWGLLSQTMRDQAAHELERARRKAKRKRKQQSS